MGKKSQNTKVKPITKKGSYGDSLAVWHGQEDERILWKLLEELDKK